jgi:hypothetical protein
VGVPSGYDGRRDEPVVEWIEDALSSPDDPT